MREMIKPKPLPPAGMIAIVAPAGPMEADLVFEGEAFLKKMGYEVLIAPSCFERKGYLAGESDAARAQDIMMMFADDEIGAILSMRGGYGANRLLPYFGDFKFSHYPKPFIGYSDITYLHLYLNQQHHVITYHGPMIKDLLAEDELTNTHFFNVIGGNNEFDIEDVPYFNAHLAPVSGTLVGGNLSIICSTLGTIHEIDTKDKILFLEEVNEPTYAIDRMLMQLSYSGKLYDASGIVLGDFNVEEKEATERLLKEVLMAFRKPIAAHVPSGHCRPLYTLPLGANVTLKPQHRKIILGS